ncbi:cob(I)yrinic acid a,c-diamide adenosyltransferase [Planctomycetes bacterium K23_9]|uniref:Corrinoid adenosyltransferase n=1 Tax=Stieleria marina TaxID=1930275 RepID=A0A517NNN7_9BACT|nr:Cob(I)yrinic acid a,c-diamide adenosyltransferase [Planctomycetes bacterium K23_9]
MKIYTRTGDTGSTGLFGGPRVGKDDCRIESYGTVDELNAAIGMARSKGVGEPIDHELDQIQHALFSIGAELATPAPDEFDLRVIGDRHIGQLEDWIDQHEATLEPLKHFILPGGTVAASHLHLARAICRRAERRVVTLGQQCGDSQSDSAQTDTTKAAAISESLIIYLNRLSDYLFVLSRAVNHQSGIAEVQWQRPSPGN